MPDELTVEELETVPEGVAELLGLAPGESVGEGVALVVEDALIVVDALSEPVPDGEGVRAAVSEDDCVGVGVGAAVVLGEIVVEPVPLSDPVLEGLAPTVSDAVGVRETERERLCVDEGVFGGVAAALADDDGVAVGQETVRLDR